MQSNLERNEILIRLFCGKHRSNFKWTCLRCTFENKSYWDICEICDTKRVLEKDETPPLRKKHLLSKDGY